MELESACMWMSTSIMFSCRSLPNAERPYRVRIDGMEYTKLEDLLFRPSAVQH